MRIFLFIISAFLLSAGFVSAQNVELFVSVRNNCTNQNVSDNATLYRVNPENVQLDPIGLIGFPGVTSLEFLGDGRLVGSAADDPAQGPKRSVLIDINPETGAGSLIGQISDASNPGECGRAPDLTYDSATDTLFATADNNCPMDDSLQTINQATGLGTLIGPYAPFDGGGNGIAINDNDVIFVTASYDLITVDPQTGAPTKVADIDTDIGNNTFIVLNALAYHPITGELYATTVDSGRTSPNRGESTLVILDTATGATQIVGDLPNCSDGLVFRLSNTRNVPTLSEWGLIALAGILGLISFMVIRRRKAIA